ncbi:MAG TPA: hypothetical protein PKE29_16755 [Phycisphaerales bacterium]|nr:hypothetical protein [Phycisphaerales bacterium]
MTAFAVGILAGLFAGNPAETILLRSLVAMVAGQTVGMIIGMICERVVNEATAGYEKAHPIGGPRPEPASGAPGAGSKKLSP